MNYTINEIKDYYYKEHKNKVFLRKSCIKNYPFYIMYDYDKKNEIDKFVSNFTEYLPYYAYTEDMLECIDKSTNLSKKLLSISKKCWKGPNIPSRKTGVNGIFGEVFLDFFERIVNNATLATTYTSRRDFRNNNENTGFDIVYFLINNKKHKIEFLFSEAKFVNDKNKAKNSLVDDINGTIVKNKENPELDHKIEGHLSKKFMNDYITFIVEKNSYFSDTDKQLLKPFIKKLNDVLINKDGNFISFLIENNVKINCVFFAIFSNESSVPEDYIKSYNEIYSNAQQQLKKIGFNNFKIEIVFIPTKSKSMEIKGAINNFYEKN